MPGVKKSSPKKWPDRPTPAACRWDKPERLRRVVAWRPSPLHSGYFGALRNAPSRRGLKAGFATLSYRWGKVKRSLHFPTAVENSLHKGIVRLPWLCALEQEQRDLPRCDVQRSCTSLRLGAFDLRAPCAAVRGGREGPQGDRHGCRSLFARAGSPVEKPGDPSRTGRLHRPAPSGGALLFGYFLLGMQEKVTRPPAGGRKPAAGEPDRDHATTERKDTGPLPAQG
ncbi:hypothetical protein DyAD56_03940 [Dyella sp. AD56]|nr:hypothetical protein DyAD56_03940 [Dyella sp. AD56]